MRGRTDDSGLPLQAAFLLIKQPHVFPQSTSSRIVLSFTAFSAFERCVDLNRIAWNPALTNAAAAA
jgi:hypothetical protein